MLLLGKGGCCVCVGRVGVFFECDGVCIQEDWNWNVAGIVVFFWGVWGLDNV